MMQHNNLNTEFEDFSLINTEEFQAYYRFSEPKLVEDNLKELSLDSETINHIKQDATKLVKVVRDKSKSQGGLDAFLFQYDLTSQEGIALMCLAESLLRIPDSESRDKLIKDKLSKGDWESHLGKSKSLFVNAATWGLMLTGKILNLPSNNFQVEQKSSLTSAFKRLTAKGGEPVIRSAINTAMKILGQQFVMERTIEKALKRAKAEEKKGYLYSYDMLGEAAFTEQDAQKYYQAYEHAIKELGKRNQQEKDCLKSPGISIKLSALHPRYEILQYSRLKQELVPRVKTLVKLAKDLNVSVTIDAEEAHVLLLSLKIIHEIISDSNLLDNWSGFGLAVQAYQKRAQTVLSWVIQQAKHYNRKLTVRLVKGAYWDTEIKLAQVNGLKDYPVFTRKVNTDLNYMVCAKLLLKANDVIYSQFATHNALTLAYIKNLAKIYKVDNFEYQCLHGMGDILYDEVLKEKDAKPCRIYAPVGGHKELLAYLVRRLLENGANTSFVNRIADEKLPLEKMVEFPQEILATYSQISHDKIPLPKDLYGKSRENSRGLDLSEPKEFIVTSQNISKFNKENNLLEYKDASVEEIIATRQKAIDAVKFLQASDVKSRSDKLFKTAQLLEDNREQLYALLIKEAGKTLDDAINEVREAIDFCRYYALEAQKYFSNPITLPGPTGELNQLSMHPRGIIACISPWNFPLAIFLGQITAALAAGNVVIAKPANQTVNIAKLAVNILEQAGFTNNSVQLLVCSGKMIDEHLLTSGFINGVVFTGSTNTANIINSSLAKRAQNGAPIVPLIAETGGQNAMIVDSSALPEQVAFDVINSAFKSAGQRCSALRVLFIQEDVAQPMLEIITGYLKELTVGSPEYLVTDVGPVIDNKAYSDLQEHFDYLSQHNDAKLVYQAKISNTADSRQYFAPAIFEINSINILTKEVFGPILHVVKFKQSQLAKIIEDINSTGYGLTLGIHSRIDETVDFIIDRAKVGNIYVNRNMIGAVVGVQPFGGEGLSGTGPKAGGPLYVPRLAIERTVSINTTAAGGNASLMSL